MANRYWVGGSATWDGTAGSKWSTTSGGAGGSAVPTSSDDVFFDAASGAVTVTTVASDFVDCLNLNFTGFTGTFAAGNTGSTPRVAGSLTLASGMTFSFNGEMRFTATAAKTITSNGKSFGCWVTFRGVGGTWQLQDAMTVTAADIVTLTDGTLDTNGMAVSFVKIANDSSGTATLTLGASTLTLTGTGTVLNFGAGGTFTVTASTSTIVISDTGASTKTFAGAGLTYNNLSITGAGSGAVIISGSNTFNTVTFGYPKTIIFTAGTTQTVTSFVAEGGAGNIITIESSSAGSAATLSKSSGTINARYCSIKDSTATGGATWNARSSTNVSGNAGWKFLNVPNLINTFF